MKKIIVVLFAVLMLAACITTNNTTPHKSKALFDRGEDPHVAEEYEDLN